MTNQIATRSFTHKTATRERVPLFIGLAGPSGGGKTYSALRLATGIQRVSGGKIFVIDSEALRALHYAKDPATGTGFDFEHVPFSAPFGSLDYLAAIEYCVANGASVIVIDSMSHEHEGPGGLLESHEQEAQRMAAAWRISVEKAKMSAWAKPKKARRRMLNTMLQLPCNFILCFRAKEKLKIEKGKDPTAMGYMAISGDEIIFEMTLNALLLPGADGVPTWHSDEIGERQQIKRPGWSRTLLPDNTQLNEDVGEALARWAAGTVVRTTSELISAFETCNTPAVHGTLEVERKAVWGKASKEERIALKAASERSQARLTAMLDADDRVPDSSPPVDNPPPPDYGGEHDGDTA